MPDAMGKLSVEELREPDVTLEIPEGRYWKLPKDIWELLNLFGPWAQDGMVYVTVPAYRYREMLETAKRLQA